MKETRRLLRNKSYYGLPGYPLTYSTSQLPYHHQQHEEEGDVESGQYDDDEDDDGEIKREHNDDNESIQKVQIIQSPLPLYQIPSTTGSMKKGTSSSTSSSTGSRIARVEDNYQDWCKLRIDDMKRFYKLHHHQQQQRQQHMDDTTSIVNPNDDSIIHSDYNEMNNSNNSNNKAAYQQKRDYLTSVRKYMNDYKIMKRNEIEMNRLLYQQSSSHHHQYHTLPTVTITTDSNRSSNSSSSNNNSSNSCSSVSRACFWMKQYFVSLVYGVSYRCVPVMVCIALIIFVGYFMILFIYKLHMHHHRHH